jgi:hypothetical protein
MNRVNHKWLAELVCFGNANAMGPHMPAQCKLLTKPVMKAVKKSMVIIGF